MSETLTFVELLFKLGATELVVSRTEPTLAVAVVALEDGRRLLAIERTYREGLCVRFDPTDEEVEIARSGDLWQLWSSDRAVPLTAVV
jgi:hypothetical protein